MNKKLLLTFMLTEIVIFSIFGFPIINNPSLAQLILLILIYLIILSIVIYTVMLFTKITDVTDTVKDGIDYSKVTYKFIKSKVMKEKEFKPFDVVIYKPTGEVGLVKSVTDKGVFVLFRIQSTASLCKFEDLENY